VECYKYCNVSDEQGYQTKASHPTVSCLIKFSYVETHSRVEYYDLCSTFLSDVRGHYQSSLPQYFHHGTRPLPQSEWTISWKVYIPFRLILKPNLLSKRRNPNQHNDTSTCLFSFSWFSFACRITGRWRESLTKFDIQPLKKIHGLLQPQLYVLPNQRKHSALAGKVIITPVPTAGGMNPPNLAFQNNW